MNKYQEALEYFIKWLNPIEEDFNQEIYRKHRNNLQGLINQSKPLTLDECIKKWEEKGFETIERENYIIFRHHKTYKTIEIYLVNLSYKTYEWYDEKRPIADKLNIDEAQFITYDIHNLITKTLKALEEEKMAKIKFTEEEINICKQLKERTILKIIDVDDEIELYRLQRLIDNLNERIPIFQQIKNVLEAWEVVKRYIDLNEEYKFWQTKPNYNGCSLEEYQTVKKALEVKDE